MFDNLLSIHAADTSRRNNALNIAEDRRSNVTTAIRASAQNLLELVNDDRDYAFKLSEYAFNKNIKILDLKIKKLNSDLEALDNVSDALEAFNTAKNEAVEEILNDPMREDARQARDAIAKALRDEDNDDYKIAVDLYKVVVEQIKNEVDAAFQYKGIHEMLLRKVREAEGRVEKSESEVGRGIGNLGGLSFENKLNDPRLGN